MKQTFDSTNIDDLNSIIARDCWSIQLLASYLEKQGIVRLYSPLELTIGIVGWLNQLAHVGQSPRKRKYTRLQLVENLLSLLGLQLTQRDFEPWIIAESDLAPNGFWRPNQLLPYAPEDIRIELYQNSINELEHKLHQTQIALNRTHAELDFVTAERKHFFAVAIENIRKLVKQDFENSTSWRITKPLRTFSALLKGNTSQDQIDARESFPTDPLTWDSVIPPWEKPGYSTEVAWRAESQGKFDRHDYVEWVKRYDTLDTLALDQLRKEALTLSQSHDAVTFSLLMIVDECPLEGFQQAVNSIQNQLYPNWELCIAIKNNADESVIQFIGSLAAHDCRIKFLQSDNTRSNLLNEALSLATGTWITHLRAANMIASQALLAMTKALISHTFCDIIYSDSDNYLLPSRSRTEPDLKPDWNLDLFYANNYIQDLCFYKSSLVHSCCGFDARIRNVNAAFFDLTLRVLEDIDTAKIKHVAQVLIHLSKPSKQLDNDFRSREINDSANALSAHFNRIRQNALCLATKNSWHIQFSLPTTLPLVSIVIPTKDNKFLLQQCLTSILNKTDYTNYEILIVDNGSVQDITLDYLLTLKSESRIRVIRDSYAFNYSALNNSAVALAKGELVAFVNDDVEVSSPNWLSDMVAHALRPGVGAVGARLWYPDMKLQHAGIVLVGGVARHVHKFLPAGESGFNDRAVLTQNFSAITGACMVVKKSLFESVGGFNEIELAIGFNDVDFCLRLLEAGYRNIWTPRAELFHHESATRGQDDAPDKQRRAEKEFRFMRERWGEKMEIDPAYNPNLTSGHDDFSLAWPPRVDTI